MYGKNSSNHEQEMSTLNYIHIHLKRIPSLVSLHQLCNLLTIVLLLQALDAAFAHYDADVRRRSDRSGERINGY